MIHRADRQLDQPIPGGAFPPVGEGQFRPRRHHPVHGGQREVGADRRACIRSPRPEYLVDDADHPEPVDHRPRRGEVTEP